MPDRRTVITGGALAVAGAGALALTRGDPLIPGTLGGADFTRGHRLRTNDFPAPSGETRTRIAIVGGGIAGLSAAWTLAEAGITDFTLLELEDNAGGNARNGRNAVSAYPLGAHYLPIPNPEAKAVIHLLERLSIVTGWRDGKPLFDPYQIVADPDERLLHLGRWQDGLVPTIGLTPTDKADLAAFFAAMTAFRDRIGSDGRPAFALPMALSSRDPDLLALDRLSFTDWLHAQGWRSPVLHAHVRYSCRDDYGTAPQHVSAWAGIHYWAGRRGASANCAGDAVLTWPEGNGHLANAMAARVRDHIRPAQVAWRVARTSDGVRIDHYDAAAKTSHTTIADTVILATPRFVTDRLLGRRGGDLGYAPWLVANVTVDRPPAGPGAKLAWDNVSWTSDSLGYVVATHQSLDVTPGPTVLTWYYPLSDEAPAAARKRLLSTSLDAWQRTVRDDLLRTQPGPRRRDPPHRHLALGPCDDPARAGLFLVRRARGRRAARPAAVLRSCGPKRPVAVRGSELPRHQGGRGCDDASRHSPRVTPRLGDVRVHRHPPARRPDRLHRPRRPCPGRGSLMRGRGSRACDAARHPPPPFRTGARRDRRRAARGIAYLDPYLARTWLCRDRYLPVRIEPRSRRRARRADRAAGSHRLRAAPHRTRLWPAWLTCTVSPQHAPSGLHGGRLGRRDAPHRHCRRAH